MKLFYLTIGGALGTLVRYFISGIVYNVVGTDFPYGTLTVNTSACFIIGFLMALAETKFILGPNVRVFLMIGFLGAFSTFSTFMFETDNLIKTSEMMKAFLNVFLSIVVGFVMLRLGVLAGKCL